MNLINQVTKKMNRNLKDMNSYEFQRYNSSIKTATVETHIHRLRKKLCGFFKPKLEIKTDNDGYMIV